MKVLTEPCWVWWCLMMLTVQIMMPSFAMQQEANVGELQGINTVTWDLNVGGYSGFLTRLRNMVADTTGKACGIPFTRSSPNKDVEYVLANLKISNTQSVTLGIDAKDLYLWGYQDKFNGKLRATFVNDAPQAARNSLFNGATKRVTKFGGNYNSLETFSRQRRQNIQLGTESLKNAIKSVYGKPEAELNNAAEAKFFLVVIQMVAEAARFRFMEQAIAAGDNTQPTKLKMVGFQNDWAKISNAMHQSQAQSLPKRCTTFNPPLEIGNLDYKIKVNKVADLAKEMGLLKYVSRTAIIASSNLAGEIGGGLAFQESADM